MFNKENNILIDISPNLIITFGELRNLAKNAVREPEYYGKILNIAGRRTLLLGLCAKKASKLIYKVKDETDVSYIYGKERYNLKIKITEIRPALPKDGFDINLNNINDIKDIKDILENKSNEVSENQADETSENKIDEVSEDEANEADKNEDGETFEFDKYIIKATALTKPVISSRREFFRLPLQMVMYCKEINFEDIDGMQDSYLKFEAASAQQHKKEADEGILEEEAGFFKLITADVSAGGFMFKSSEMFEPETYLNCMMIVDKEALPVVAKILRSREDKILNGYIVQVQFYKISETVRNRLVKYLLNIQMQQRNSKHNRFFRR